MHVIKIKLFNLSFLLHKIFKIICTAIPHIFFSMCVDFIDLNKTYLKDSYPLPQINQLVNAISEHELLSFMDAFIDYN